MSSDPEQVIETERRAIDELMPRFGPARTAVVDAAIADTQRWLAENARSQVSQNPEAVGKLTDDEVAALRGAVDALVAEVPERLAYSSESHWPHLRPGVVSGDAWSHIMLTEQHVNGSVPEVLVGPILRLRTELGNLLFSAGVLNPSFGSYPWVKEGRDRVAAAHTVVPGREFGEAINAYGALLSELGRHRSSLETAEHELAKSTALSRWDDA